MQSLKQNWKKERSSCHLLISEHFLRCVLHSQYVNRALTLLLIWEIQHEEQLCISLGKDEQQSLWFDKMSSWRECCGFDASHWPLNSYHSFSGSFGSLWQRGHSTVGKVCSIRAAVGPGIWEALLEGNKTASRSLRVHYQDVKRIKRVICHKANNFVRTWCLRLSAYLRSLLSALLVCQKGSKISYFLLPQDLDCERVASSNIDMLLRKEIGSS